MSNPMLTPEEMEAMLQSFRSQYDEIYVTEIGGDDFVWRALTRKEHSDIVKFAMSEDDAHERICQVAVLWPKLDYRKKVKAYIPSQLAPQILYESGFVDGNREVLLLDSFRQKMMSFDMQAEVIIKTAFPDITFEEMANWTKEKLMLRLAQAEWQLTELRKVPLKLVRAGEPDPDHNPEEYDDEGEIIEGWYEEETEDPIMQIAEDMRKQGIDPMLTLRDLIKKPKPSYVERPMIGGSLQTDGMLAGTDAWRMGVHDGRYQIIQQQVQKVSRR